MRHAALLCLLIATPARAGLWEWTRQPVTACDKAEIRRIATLTSLPRCALEAEMDRERAAYNGRALRQYNGMLPPIGAGPARMAGYR